MSCTSLTLSIAFFMYDTANIWQEFDNFNTAELGKIGTYDEQTKLVKWLQRVRFKVFRGYIAIPAE